jgi:small membrane protein
MAAEMIIQILLALMLLLLAMFVGLQASTPRGVRLLVLTMLAGGAFLVWQPEHANDAASVLGVGRGADLLFYLWIVITLAVIFLLYLKIVRMNRMLTELARRLAIERPIRPANRPPSEWR